MTRRFFTKLAALLPFTLPALAKAKPDFQKYMSSRVEMDRMIKLWDKLAKQEDLLATQEEVYAAANLLHEHMRGRFLLICGKLGVGKSLLFDWLTFYKQTTPIYTGVADIGHIDRGVAIMRHPGMNQQIKCSMEKLLDDLKIYGEHNHTVVTLPPDNLSVISKNGQVMGMSSSVPTLVNTADWVIEVLGHGGENFPDNAWWACRTVSCGRFPGIDLGEYGYERTWVPQKFVIQTGKDWIVDKMIPVKAAQLLGVCRICGGDTREALRNGDTLILQYGAEYAHANCLLEAGILPNKGTPVCMD